MKRKLYIFILGLFCLLCNCCSAQLDVIHYLPPFIGEGSWMKMDSTFLYITTPSKNPVTFTIKTGTTLLYSGTVSLYAPVRWLIGKGDNTVISLPNDSLNKALNNHGLIIEASYGIYVNERTIRNPQAASLCTKGKNALGTNFRIGHMWNDSTTTKEDNGIGIMATEDNTVVTLKVLGRKLGFGYAPGSLTLPTPTITPGKNITFTLNKYQTYVLDASSGVMNSKGQYYLSSNDGLMGTNLVSNKPIAVVTGSFTGGAWNGMDDGFDEIEDEKHIGSQFIFMEGAGITETTNNEVAVIVADQNNTSIYVNGAATPIATINAGSYYVIQGTNYVNNNMYVKTSQSVYAYQTYMGSDKCCTYDMTFIPPLYQCVIQDTVVISDVEHIGNTTFTGAVRIVAKAGVPVYVNGVAAVGPIPVTGNLNYVLYVISNATGEYVITSAEPIQAGYYGLNSNLGYGSLFSGFNECQQSYTICKGDSILLKANPTFPTNKWLFNNDTIAKDTLSLYAKDSGNYVIDYGPYLYDTIPLYFYAPTPIHITGKNYFCKGDSLLLKATTGFTNYKWSNNETNVNFIYAKKSGWYWVTATDSKGCTARDSIQVFKDSVLLKTSVSPILCYGNSTAITATVESGTAPYTYSWNTSPTQTNYIATNLSAGSYRVLVIDSDGCRATAKTVVTQPSILIDSIIAIGTVSCHGESNGSATIRVKGATPPYTYSWSPSSQTTAKATGLEIGTYSVTITDANGCKSVAIATITQPAALAVEVNGSQTICKGSTIPLTAIVSGGTRPYTYAWSTGAVASTASVTPATPQTYWVTITDANGCSTTGYITINFDPPLFVTVTGEASVCQNIPVTLCANATGGINGTYIYSWDSGYSSTPCISVTPSITTTYTVSVVDNCGASATAPGTVQINSLPNVNFNSSIYYGCMPLCIQFYNYSTVPGGNAESYDWTFGNGATVSSQSAIYCYPDSGTYTVGLTVTSDSGCSSTLQRKEMIHVFGNPHAAFTVSPQPTDILAPTVHFKDQATDPNGGITYWTWTYGDNLDSIGSTQNTIHTYQDTGSYCAKLVVMDHMGCTDTATNCLIIDPIFTLYIPNAFTPNGDGMNEAFTAKGAYVKYFEMYIFDRWGEQVFYSNDINKGWKGTLKDGATISQEGTYVYKITATDTENKQHSYLGYITLLK